MTIHPTRGPADDEQGPLGPTGQAQPEWRVIFTFGKKNLSGVYDQTSFWEEIIHVKAATMEGAMALGREARLDAFRVDVEEIGYTLGTD